MSGICGWAGCNGPIDHNNKLLNTMAKVVSIHEMDEPESKLHGHFALAAGSHANTELFHSNENGWLAITGHTFFNGNKLSSQNISSANEIISSYLANGPKVLRRFSGIFALAIVIPNKNKALIATDRKGCKPIRYVISDNSLIFATASQALNIHPLTNRELDPQSLFNYLYYHMIPGPGTVFKGQHRLTPGTYVEFENGVIKNESYWLPEYTHENDSAEVDAYKDELNNLLRKSVGSHIDSVKVGTFLSGGIDSSTVTGVTSEFLGDKTDAYSIGFDQKGYDEMEYARSAAKHFGVRHHAYYVTPQDVVDAIPEIANSYSDPFGNSSAIPTYYCAKLAQADGIDLLLAGDGGDELFAGNERYAQQQALALYEKIPPLIRKCLIQPAVNLFPFGNQVTPVRKARSYIQQATTPMPDRLERYNLLRRLGAATVCNAEFLQQINENMPLDMLGETYHTAKANTILNKQLAVDFKFTLADSDLPKVNIMCQLAGVDVAYPLLNDELVDFSARLPVSLKLRNGQLRYFFKEAVRGFLPDEILTKSKHGFGLPFGQWMQTYKPLNELACDSLTSLKKRGIIRSEFIDELINVHIHNHAAYYGTMIWVLMMLEQWFSQHNQEANH